MNEDLKKLYRTVGIAAPLPNEATSFGGIGAEALAVEDSADLPPLDAENLEKVVIEALGFALFVMGFLPFFAEILGPPPDFVPA